MKLYSIISRSVLYFSIASVLLAGAVLSSCGKDNAAADANEAQTVTSSADATAPAGTDTADDTAIAGTASDSKTDGTSADSNTADASDGTASESSDLTLSFSAETLDGTKYTQDDFSDAQIIMVNLWEPWCGPCRAEMPYLEKLYETYADQGLVILGVYTTTDMNEDVAALQKELQITYPLLNGGSQLQQFMTPYVPTTWFFRGDGSLLIEEPEVGAHEYEYWEEIVQSCL